MSRKKLCPECESVESPSIDRRQFGQAMGVAAAAVALPRVLGSSAVLAAEKKARKEDRKSETLVQKLYGSLNDKQKEELCFPWDYKDDRGLLRTHVSNNWHITSDKDFNVASDFFTSDQRDMVEALFFGLYNSDWHDRIRKQLKDDAGGYGKAQSFAIFGEPGSGKFEFVMTGRHLTVRCDGDSSDHVAFGGPIFYGHAAQGFNERADHPGNVFWPQAVKANALYDMLDGKQREVALIEKAPRESAVAFRGKKEKQGIPVSELSSDQKKHVREVLDLLVEPYRMTDRNEVEECLKKQGGLDACQIAFYKFGHNSTKSRDGDIGDDGVWDNWRLEGPSLVWHYRGAPHVHVWVNVSDDPGVALNARG
jgi:hypothetical protein